ncbi:hypothetical protein [Anaeromyxobacter oryzisoli]|uniref:hypothetical protein n=1 Tax=Anaeromyxobacter oryzisoli TaxID=2925408 RepID=UPI001F55D018|nr:hypothetical protein [Anaeromyxobacter sp. SG63]
MLSYTRERLAALLLGTVFVFTPGPASADRGALTLEVGGFGSVSSLPPGVGTGTPVTGTSLGGVLGVRYAPLQWLELSAGGFYEAPASYFHAGTSVTNENGSFIGTLQSRVGSWGMTVGARYVRGLVWRYFIGLEAGFARRTASQLDLIDVTDPASPRSFGLGLADVTTTELLLAPLVGVEWAVSDHVTLGLSSRLQIHLAERSSVEFIVPMTVSYSWYVL